MLTFWEVVPPRSGGFVALVTCVASEGRASMFLSQARLALSPHTSPLRRGEQSRGEVVVMVVVGTLIGTNCDVLQGESAETHSVCIMYLPPAVSTACQFNVCTCEVSPLQLIITKYLLLLINKQLRLCAVIWMSGGY